MNDLWTVMQNNLIVRAGLPKDVAEKERDKLQEAAGNIAVTYWITPTEKP